MLRSPRFLRFVFVFLPSLLLSQTVDEIIAKNIEAHGGIEKMKAVQTIRSSGKLNMGDFRANFVEEIKRPNEVREETIIQGFAQIDALDGKIAWRINPFEGRKDAELISADDMKGLIEESDIDGPLVDYRNKDHRAEYVGHDSVEGTDCYKIKLTLSDGDVRFYYIDTDSFLELKIETQRSIRGTVQYSETLYGDYEKVNGLYYPFAYETGETGNPNRVKFTVDKIEVNVPIPDSRFVMPTTGAAQ